jgi:hypothetical protein
VYPSSLPAVESLVSFAALGRIPTGRRDGMRLRTDKRPLVRYGPGVRIGTEPWELEHARRSVGMAPDHSPAPITCGELRAILARLQRAEEQLRLVRGA